jgi:hypothetical protein
MIRITPRGLVYVYIAMLILEGALRKWFVPGSLSKFIGIIRDPIALYLLWNGVNKGHWRRHWMFDLWWGVGVLLAVSGLLAMIEDPYPLNVWLFGLRIALLHFPLIFIIPHLLGPEDLDVLMRRLILLALPIALLMVWQYRSDAGAWVNRTAFEGGSLLQAAGRVRPPGPFSFNTGAAEYFALINAFLMAGLLNERLPLPWIVYGGASTLLAYSVSGSRLMFGYLSIVWFGTLGLRWLARPRWPSFNQLVQIAAGLVLIVLLISFTPLGNFINEGRQTTEHRATTANKEDGGFFGRGLRMFSIPDHIVWQPQLFGRGIGIGTNYGSSLLTGQAGFVLEENEWPRVIQESGLVVGSLFIAFRLLMTLYVGLSAWKPLLRGDVLPTALFFSNTVIIVVGNIGRPTSQGFTVLSMALALTAARWSPSRSPAFVAPPAPPHAGLAGSRAATPGLAASSALQGSGNGGFSPSAPLGPPGFLPPSDPLLPHEPAG